MQFIPRIDEVLVTPPYTLDSDGVPFQSNIFILPAKHERLQALVDEQLNAAMPNGPFVYTVPNSVQRVFLAFYRYETVQSAKQPAKGHLGYIEAMMGFLARRTPIDGLPDDDPHKDLPSELVTYLGVVYIGDLAFGGPSKEPFTLPIVFGRSLYGLPKNPAQVFYEPTSPHLPNRPKVDVWDPPPGGGDLTPKTAIRVMPKMASSLRRRPLVPAAPPPKQRRDRIALEREHVEQIARVAPKRRIPKRPRRDWRIFAELLGVRGRLEIEAAAIGDPNAVMVHLPEEDVWTLAWTNLLWRTKLVGLKEFPDPKGPFLAGDGLGQACYRAIVESPLEETPENLLGQPKFIYFDQQVEFPVVQRVDLIDRFGIIPTSGRVVDVGTDSMFYQKGSLLFADPAKVNVWQPL